jgi:hypothetical protein
MFRVDYYVSHLKKKNKFKFNLPKHSPQVLSLSLAIEYSIDYRVQQKPDHEHGLGEFFGSTFILIFKYEKPI